MMRIQTICLAAGIALVVGCSEQAETESAEAAPAVEPSADQSSVSQPEPDTLVPWAGYDFAPNFVEVNGSRMHYVDEGPKDGDVFLFLHGNPTSSYLWRNIIPYVTSEGRAVAPDNIGFGRSEKPDIGYTFAEHAEYLEGFIEALDLNNIILVIHDWGSALGFDYAASHPERIKGVVFMEAITGAISMADMPDQFREVFGAFRTPGVGEQMVIEQNMFIEQMLPGAILRTLSEGEMNAYRQPFLFKETRKPLLVWPRQVPIDGEPADVVARVNTYMDALAESELPKLMFYVEPGAIAGPELVETLKAALPNLETVNLGEGRHFVQEDHADEIGQWISEWYARNFGEGEY